MSFFDRPHIKRFGYLVLALAIGFAAGNAHKTHDALEGQAAYFKKAEAKHVKAVAAKVADGVRKEDAGVVGVAPQVLNQAVQATKGEQ